MLHIYLWGFETPISGFKVVIEVLCGGALSLALFTRGKTCNHNIISTLALGRIMLYLLCFELSELKERPKSNGAL